MMEKKFVRVPFDVEMAKRISDGGVDGRIVTNTGKVVRIVCWDMRRGYYSILALIEFAESEDPCCFDNSGKTKIMDEWLELEVPAYMSLKDGDFYKTDRGSIAIYNGNYKAVCNNLPYYVGLRAVGNQLVFHDDNNQLGFGLINECRLDVTEEDKQRLFNALKESKEPKAKEYLKLFFDYEYKEFEPKPFDKVLCRDNETHKWFADFFSHKLEDGRYCCIGLNWKYCIPYNDRTAHLLGTTDNYNEDEKAME